MREKYRAVIKDGDTRITTLLSKAQEVFQDDPEGLKLLGQITDEYNKFQKQAEVARGMRAFQDTYVEGIRAADQYTGDRGVATIGMIKELAKHAAGQIEGEFDGTAKATMRQNQDTAIAVQGEVRDHQPWCQGSSRRQENSKVQLSPSIGEARLKTSPLPLAGQRS